MIAYTVICEIEDSVTAAEWVSWLKDEHLADVCAAGALSATLVQMNENPQTYEVRYTFASWETFSHYETHSAPALREEGLRLFPLSRGLSYRRTVGEVIAAHKPATPLASDESAL